MVGQVKEIGMSDARVSRRGFTLVELLVVIGIIALLISILLPALNKAREDASRVRALSNERQLTMAWMMYASDNKGHICSSNTQTLGTPGFDSWVAGGNTLQSISGGVLWPYVKAYEIYKDPNDRINYTHTFSINGYLAGESRNAITTTGQLHRAYATFVFIEELDPRGFLENSFIVNPYPSNTWNDIPAPMHKGVGIISFADGHAQVWPWADPRTGNLTVQNTSTPNSPDLRQLQAWIGQPPYPPGVLQ